MADFTLLTDNKSHSIKSMIPAIIEVFKSLEYKIFSVFDELKKDFLDFAKKYDEEICLLKREISSVKKQMASLEEKVDENDAYERRDTLIMSGAVIPTCTSSENCMELTKTILNDHLKYVISPSDISTVHRLGKKPVSQKPDNRDIIIKFCRHNTKIDLLAAARRVKPTNLFLNESLTPQRHNISYALRKARREFPDLISGTSTIDGKVFVWVKPPNPLAAGSRDTRISVNSYSKLENFCQTTLQVPMSHFITRKDL